MTEEAAGERDLPATRKARGAFFTPAEICDFIVAWALRRSDDRVLEPSCGEAAFLLSAGKRLAALGCTEPTVQLHWFDQLQGVELHEHSALQASVLSARAGLGATIHVGDFFDYGSERGFDAVVGNPPYVRYQDWSGEARRSGQARALAQGVRISGLASSWAPFLVHATGLLAPEGRLGLVLPAELLSVNYAAPIRRFLLDRFNSVRLVMFEQRVFPGVLEEVVLLLAEGTGPTDHFTLHQLRDLTDLSEIDRVAAAWHPPTRTDKWLPALLPPHASEIYTEVVAKGAFEQLHCWGHTSLGMVTGNNKYFVLSSEEARKHELPRSDLLPVSPPGSRHLRGAAFTQAAFDDLRDAGAQCFLFYPKGEPGEAARRYIERGEEEGVHTAYKCRVRTPWWRVPLVPPPDLLLTYMNHDCPRLVSNPAQLRYLNSVHGVSLAPERKALGRNALPVAALNSLTMLGAELVGRSYGGGMLKLEPTEADVLPVPSFPLTEAAASDLDLIRPQLGQHLRGGDLEAAVSLVDEVVLVRHGEMKHASVRTLRRAREGLFERRSSRSGKRRGED